MSIVKEVDENILQRIERELLHKNIKVDCSGYDEDDNEENDDEEDDQGVIEDG